MKIAITGATGHLGSAILPELIGRHYEIKALVRESDHTFGDLSVEIVQGDLLNQETLRQLLKDCDALIHCAAIISINGDPDGLVSKTNIEGTKLLMETAKQCKIKRVVHVSSIHAYKQKPSLEILDEQRTMVDENAFAYDRSKKAGQQIALSMNQPEMEVLVVNPTSIIGPYDYKPSKMGKVIIDLYKGKLPFVFDGGFDFCDCRDVAKAVVNAISMGKPGENYLLGGKWYSFRQLTNLLSDISGKKIRAASLPIVFGKMGLPIIHAIAWLGKSEPLYTNEALEATATGNRKINSDKAKFDLGYLPRPFEETLADTLHWFKQKSYLV
ncbi:MAG: NAD-dependent epimerase/dehydratase family protein [Bacteroidetes bacterium]|nr:NAD-dependent epimerase/dehydratase family protein [Bacteroidota bacterium]